MGVERQINMNRRFMGGVDGVSMESLVDIVFK